MNETTAVQVLMAIAGAAGALLVSGISYVVARVWKPVEGIEEMRLRLSKQEDRLAAGASTFNDIKIELKEIKSKLQMVELDLARLVGTGRIKIIREESEEEK